MICTLTNTSGRTLNDLDVHDGGSLAVGGQRKDPLPYPFRHIGALLDTGTSVLSMMQSDFRFKTVYWLTHEPKDEWNGLVHKGLVTMAFATQNSDPAMSLQDQEEIAKNTL